MPELAEVDVRDEHTLQEAAAVDLDEEEHDEMDATFHDIMDEMDDQEYVDMEDEDEDEHVTGRLLVLDYE